MVQGWASLSCGRVVDDALVVALNRAARSSGAARGLVSGSATALAGLEVLLMALLAVAGRPRAAMRMFGAVGLVYVASEVLGAVWPRRRPFAQLSSVEALAPHDEKRSFPSRHVASGLAMAGVAHAAHPRLGGAMTAVAWLLGVSRLAAGLHYPTDVLAGALLGTAIGRLFRD
jgi:membrane-associated phospholipid phosphatase